MDGRRNFRVTIEGRADAKSKAEKAADIKMTLKNDARQAMYEAEDVEELEKTRLEKKICQDMCLAVKLTLDKSRLKKFADLLDVSTDDIHMLSVDELSRLVPESPGVTAFNQWGDTYVTRTSNKVQLARDISHELSHCISFRSARVTYHTGREAEDSELAVNEDRVGPSFIDSNVDHLRKFLGLTEAMTELFARRIRLMFNTINKNLSFDEKKELDEMVVYYEHLLVVEEIIERLSSNENEAQEWFKELMQNHITGSYSFLNRAEIKLPGVTKVLAEMGKDPEDALRAAKILKLDDAVRVIRELVEEEKVKKDV